MPKSTKRSALGWFTTWLFPWRSPTPSLSASGQKFLPPPSLILGISHISNRAGRHWELHLSNIPCSLLVIPSRCDNSTGMEGVAWAKERLIRPCWANLDPQEIVFSYLTKMVILIWFSRPLVKWKKLKHISYHYTSSLRILPQQNTALLSSVCRPSVCRVSQAWHLSFSPL